MIEPKARPKNRQYNLYHANFYCCCDRRRYRCHTSILVNSRPEWAANNRRTSNSNRECSRHLAVGCFFWLHRMVFQTGTIDLLIPLSPLQFLPMIPKWKEIMLLSNAYTLKIFLIQKQ